MSRYETPEQLQIRESREKITSLTRQLANITASHLQEIADLRRRQEEENEQLLSRLRDQQDAARRDREAMSASLQNLDAQVRERESLLNERIQAMQNQHYADLQRLQEEFEAEQQGLKDEIGHTRREMRAGLTQVREETDRKLEQQRAEIDENISRITTEFERQIREVDGKVSALARQIASKEKGDKELAVYWAQEAARLINQNRETFRSQLFNERAAARLDRAVQLANESIQSGQYQTAISSGRNAFFDALDMKEELAEAELEWNYWFNAVMSRRADLLQALDDAENIVYTAEILGERVEYTNGMDYWTYGQLTIVQNQVSELQRRLQNTEQMTLAELQEAEEQLRALQEQLALVDNAAQTNIAMSGSRYETAVKIGEILGSEYNMVNSDGEFFGRENRDEYHAVFQNPNTNDRAVVTITPIPDEEGIVTNHIDLLIDNADNSAATRKIMADVVGAELRERIEGCSFPCSGRFEEKTPQEVCRVGNIEAVEAGDKEARAELPAGVRMRTQQN